MFCAAASVSRIVPNCPELSRIVPPPKNQIRSAQMQLVKKTKKLRNGPISLQKNFEPNPCMHARATAVFVRARPF